MKISLKHIEIQSNITHTNPKIYIHPKTYPEYTQEIQPSTQNQIPNKTKPPHRIKSIKNNSTIAIQLRVLTATQLKRRQLDKSHI